MPDNSVAIPFWAKVVKETGTFCWGWAGSKDAGGYGKVRGKRAHRVSYEIHRGPIPDGMYVCHSCDNPPCCNPDHLFLGTAYDNNADRAAKRKVVGSATKTLTQQVRDVCLKATRKPVDVFHILR